MRVTRVVGAGLLSLGVVIAAAGAAYAYSGDYFNFNVPGFGGVVYTNYTMQATSIAPKVKIWFWATSPSNTTLNFGLYNAAKQFVGIWHPENPQGSNPGYALEPDLGSQLGHSYFLAAGSPAYYLSQTNAYGYWQP